MADQKEVYNIAVISGDGIGPEVVAEGMKVLRAVAEVYRFQINETPLPYSSQDLIDQGHLMPSTNGSGLLVPNKASKLYVPEKNGLALPPAFFDDLKKNYDAMLFGSVGDPRVDRGIVEEMLIGGLRWSPKLELYVNLRPVKLYTDDLCRLKGVKKEDFDFVIVRENTEGLYGGKGYIRNKGTPDEVAVREMIASRKGTERIIRYAFEYARANNRGKVTLVDKANVMRNDVGWMWRTVFKEVSREYDDIETDALYIDNGVMEMVNNAVGFDVIVTSNLFGDIASDLGAALAGGIGTAPSGNINPGKFSYFESVHGSAPNIAGKGIAVPFATISSVALMLRHMGEVDAAKSIDEAIQYLFDDKMMTDVTADNGRTTQQITDLVLERIIKEQIRV